MQPAKHHLPTALLALILGGAFLPDVSAQEQGGEAADSAVQIRVLCSQPVVGATELKLVQNGVVLHELGLEPAMVSDSIAVGRGDLVLARQAAAAGELDPVLKIPMPASGRRFVLALFPSSDTDPKTPYRHVVMRIDELRFGTTELYLFNLTGDAIEGMLGTSSFSLAADASEVVTPVPETAGERTYRARFHQVREDGKYLFSDATWPLAASARVYLFFLPNPFRESVSFVSFREYAPFD